MAAGLAVLSAGDRLGATGDAITAGLEGADLIELANQGSPDRAGGPISPASPTIGTTGTTVPGSTTTIEIDPDLPAHEQVGLEALAGITYPWQEILGDWTIEFQTTTDGLYGLTLVPERKIEIYVRPDQSPSMVRHVIAHEIGHAVDVTLNDGSDRRRWTEARDIDAAPWWPESGAADFQTGAGDFAESFAAWQVGPSGFRSELAPPPNAVQIQLLAELSAS
ncbi:MAG: hypothetical protein AAFO29_22775 [Actinomycetota bacterium]